MKVKIITLNLWIGGKLFNGILDFINAEDPDILLLQEVHNGENKQYETQYRSLQIFQQNTKLKEYFFSPCFRDTTEKYSVQRGNAIFSKYSIKETDYVYYGPQYREYKDVENLIKDWSVLPRALQHATIDIYKQIFNIYNTQGIWGLDGKDSPERLEMSQCIVDQIKDKQNVILGGDFNVQPNTQTIKNLEKYVKNVFKDDLTLTFNMKRKSNPGYASAVVDMLFISPQIKILDNYCPQVDISDHLPLVMTLDV